jgi:feruloyl esterase
MTGKAMTTLEKIFIDAEIRGCTITCVQMVPAGSFTLPDGKTITDLPAFCRVTVNLKPTPQSNIQVEIWQPQENWNGRFLGTGNGGGAGSISYAPLAFGLRRGYATANTDLGTSPNANAAIDQPERWADFGYRATHEMTVVAKELIQLFYKRPARYAYFIGCSTGGQQALMEAQRYPSDYNGIIAGAPANNRTHLHTGFLWNYAATKQVPGLVFSKEQIELITNTVIDQWRGKDGGALDDNFLTDPRRCNFDPDTIPNCKGTDNNNGLTYEQLSVLKRIYAGPTNPRTGERIYTPLPYGSEACSGGVDLQQDSEKLPLSLLYPFKWVFGADFDYTKFDFDRDLDTLDDILAPILNANNPDLSAMKELGGKILMYAGMSDPLVPFQDALHYYERVIEDQGGIAQTQDFFRFFLVPGMGHCGGGPGLNDIGLSGASQSVQQDSEHDILSSLVEWVEHGKAPEKIIATAFKDSFAPNGISFQRPIYPYPKLPEYVDGDPNLPSSYQGVDHLQGGVLIPAEKYLV